jgi:glycosyltransferase involved in cell wall biosynthesis
MERTVINVIYNASISPGMSGGTRIFIEIVRRWAMKGLLINIFTSDDGFWVCRHNKLMNVRYFVWSTKMFERFGVMVLFIFRIIKGALTILRTVDKFRDKDILIYSCSDFWPDSILGWLMKKRLNRAKWIAGFYMFAPKPFSRTTPYKGRRFLKGLLYYLSQIPIYYLVRKYADMVWVTNELDRWMFIDNVRFSPDKVIAVHGGIDARTPALIPEPKEKEFDAVFIGRFHPQKGVLELIDIWRYVCERKKDAKLAMIGVGELEKEIRAKIKKYGLENNIVLFGFKDGIEKLKIFKDSKIVVHPAIYDSGGMAPCEAMACGLPGVSFDLPALKLYYPKGMLKTPCFDFKKFAENIISLLEERELYEKLSKEALEWAQEWDWDKKAEKLLQIVKRILK